MREECPNCGELIALDDWTTRVREYRCSNCHTTVVDPVSHA